MIFEEKEYLVNGNRVVLRSAKEDEAKLLVDYLKTVTGETRFLRCDPEEIQYTEEGEKEFIRKNNESNDGMMIMAYLNDEFVGNCSFERKTTSKRNVHRAEIGIALYQKFTGQGIGTIMMKALIEEMKKAGFEKCELSVIEGNDGAYKLYEKLGFKECGRMSKANKYKDGTYADEILMELFF